MNSDNAQQISAIVASLEDDVVFGRLAPWQELIEDALMDRFQAKRHVVRAAITRLVESGLIVKPPNKSARVRELGIQEVKWIYEVRMRLSAMAAQSIVLPVSQQALQELKENQYLYCQAITNGVVREIRLWNDRFHNCFFNLAPNPLLVEEVRRFTRMTDPIRSTGIVDADWLKLAVKEHDAMIHAIEKNDATALTQLVLAHMEPVRDRWLQRRQAQLIA